MSGSARRAETSLTMEAPAAMAWRATAALEVSMERRVPGGRSG